MAHAAAAAACSEERVDERWVAFGRLGDVKCDSEVMHGYCLLGLAAKNAAGGGGGGRRIPEKREWLRV